MNIKYLLVSFTFISTLVLSGCGQSSSNLTTIVDTNNTPASDKDSYLHQNQQDPTFATIQGMISAAGHGDMADVTYISIGDSTRAHTQTPDGSDNRSDYIFRDINASLADYNVKGVLVSQGGLTFQTFLGREHYDPTESRTWINIQEAIDQIPGDGNSTIVNISMASNDVTGILQHELSADQQTDYQIYGPIIRDRIKAMLLETIAKLRETKPNIKVMLTSANPYKDWENGSATYHDAFAEVATELQLPYADFVTEIMPDPATSQWYLDGIHFNQEVGIPAVVEFIKGKILPQ